MAYRDILNPFFIFIILLLCSIKNFSLPALALNHCLLLNFSIFSNSQIITSIKLYFKSY